ncbi:MAG: hypothetical protein RLY93_17290 [Sumerlaeia bacterium]
MNKTLFTLALATGLGATAAMAQTVTELTTEAEINVVLGGSDDFRPSGSAVSAVGEVFFINRGPANEVLMRYTPGSDTLEVIADADAMFAAIDAVNTDNGATAFNPRQLEIAADGDLIVLGFASGATADAVVSVSNSTSPTITVVYAPVGAATDSVLDGSNGLTVLGNTAYVTVDQANGSENAVFSIDTNTALATPNKIVAGTDMATLFPAITDTAGNLAINDLTTDGTDLLGIVSNTADAPDAIVRITTAGVISEEVPASEVIADLAAIDASVTDVGYGAITLDGTGRVVLANGFGDGSFDEGFLFVDISGATSSTTGLTGDELAALIGLTSPDLPLVRSDTISYDNTNMRLIFGHDATGFEGMYALESVNTADVEGWDLYN